MNNLNNYPKIELFEILDKIYNDYTPDDYKYIRMVRRFRMKIFDEICTEMVGRTVLYDYSNCIIEVVGYHRNYGMYLNLVDNYNTHIQFLYDWSEVYLIE